MRKTEFGNNFPVGILLESEKVICEHAKIEELMKEVDQHDCENKFPIYFTSLKKTFYATVH